MTVMHQMTPSVNASKFFPNRHWTICLLSVALAVVPGSSSSVEVFASQDSNPPSDSLVDVGTRFVQGNPDTNFVREMNRMGLHPLSLEMTLRRRSEIVPSDPNGSPANAGVSPAGAGHNTRAGHNARARWGILWMETLADEQVFNYPARIDDTDSVREALQKIDAFAAQETASPRFAWTLLKGAWCRWYVCRSVVAAHLATPARTLHKKVALDEIRTALEQIEEVENLAADIPTGGQNASGRSAGAPTATEVSSLIVESKLLGCDLLVLRAHLYEDQIEERIACGTQMLSMLDEVDRRISLEFQSQSQIDLARARAWLFTNQFAKVIELVQNYQSSDRKRATPTDVLQHMAALASEASRLGKDFVQASRWIESGGGWLAAPQLALESLTLDLGQLADGDEAGLARVLEKKKTIADRFGPYWAQRADAVLISRKAVPSDGEETMRSDFSLTASLSILRTEVKQLLAGKQFEPAMVKLKQAETAAKRLELPDEGVGFALQFAALAGLQKDFQRAAVEFQRASLEYSDTSLAPRAAMNAIAMAQEQIKALSKGSEFAQTDEDRATYQDNLKRITDLRTEVWLSVLERWPESEQGQSSASGLAHFYLSTDRVWEVAELWCGLWERLTDPSISLQSVQASSGYLDTVAEKSLDSFRLLAFLKNQSVLDSNVIGTGTGERWGTLKGRLERLCLNSKEHSDAFKSHLALEVGYGWEFSPEPLVEDAIDDQSDRLHLWMDAHIALAQLLAKPRAGDCIERLQGTLQALERSPRFASAENSHLASMVERSIRMMNLAWQSQLGDGESPVSAVQKMEAENPKDPWWGYYAGRIYQTIPSQRELALKRFVQLAGSMPAGSDGWIECHARSIQTLRQLGRLDEANKLVNMVVALHSKLSVQWKNRIQSK